MLEMNVIEAKEIADQSVVSDLEITNDRIKLVINQYPQITRGGSGTVVQSSDLENLLSTQTRFLIRVLRRETTI